MPLEGSPVIDRGSCASSTDQRGVPRPIDGNLDNAGERVTLAGPFGEILLDFSYGDGGSWPGRPIGALQ